MLIVEKQPKSIVAETYRTLRTNLQYSSIDEEYKVVVITSSEPGEGKSTTAGNLALSLAQGEHKVLLIDCDLRKPSLHKKFNLSNVKGLSDVIIRKEAIGKVTHKYCDGLIILTAGAIPPNPSEVLASKAMTKLLNELKEIFDYIILDTPPVQAVTDAQILSTKSDGTLLVVRAEKTKKDVVVSSLKLLKKVNANILGTILNDADTGRNNHYYYGEENKK